MDALMTSVLFSPPSSSQRSPSAIEGDGVAMLILGSQPSCILFSERKNQVSVCVVIMVVCFWFGSSV